MQAPLTEADLAVNINATFIVVYLIIIVLFYIYYYYENSMKINDDEIDEFNDIMMGFHKDPDYDDFMKIWNSKQKIIKVLGKPTKYWIWGVFQTQPQFFTERKKQELNEWIREIERGLRRIQTNPTSDLLDCIWALYFATGDVKYSEIIRKVASNAIDINVRNSAKRSYKSIMKKEVNDEDRPINNEIVFEFTRT
jgi:hypothetical protein